MIASATSTADLRHVLGEIFRPTERLTPSAWAEANRHLKPGTTPSPGRWRNDFLPWLQPMLDAFDQTPWAEGVVTMKPTQVAGSEVHITLLGHLFTYDPGPALYLCTTQDIAREFSLDRFQHMIESSPSLRSRFRLGKGARETTFVKEAVGGKLIIAGSGSPNKLISRPCRYVMIDEEDRLPDFPGMGSAREIAEKRIAEYETRCRTGIFSWAHPTGPEVGVAATYHNQSDQREWTIACPHCEKDLVPSWNHVTIHDRNPDTATYACPHCGSEITDLQRWRATRAGRFESQLPRGERNSRRFVGFHLSRLCHPRTTLHDLAVKYCACHSESQLRVFYNMVLGLPYTDASFVLTAEAVENKVDPRATQRTAPSDTRIVTIGVDVQKGPEHPVLYYTATAWTGNGNCHLIEYGKLMGWPALDAYLRGFELRTTEGHARRPDGCAIDHGYKTREVYGFCRQDHGGVPCIPVKHTPGVMPSQPTREKKTIDPMHPEHGRLKRYELSRDYWMDRTLGRFHPEADPTIGSSIVLCPVNREFVGHIKSARRGEIVDRNGHSRLSWMKEKGEPDDWLQALVYAECCAVAAGLDQMHERLPKRPPDQQMEVAEGFVTRGQRTVGRPGGFIRGRRGRRP